MILEDGSYRSYVSYMSYRSCLSCRSYYKESFSTP
jgi:hypothetical protein